MLMAAKEESTEVVRIFIAISFQNGRQWRIIGALLLSEVDR